MPNRRVYARQDDLVELKNDIKEIKTNHIPHLQAALNKITGELYVLIPLIMAILGLVIYVLLVKD